MRRSRPRVFVGSSSEGLAIAEALQQNLDAVCDVTIWSQGVFGLSSGTLESLVRALPDFDFAVLVMTPDDLVEVRGERAQSARDNVLMEIGMAIGFLGRERTFALFERSSGIRIPSDLAGITLADWRMHGDGNLRASLGSASTRIKAAIGDLGVRPPNDPTEKGSAFLAVPMNAFNVAGQPERYTEFREHVLNLMGTLRENRAISDVFCAVEEIETVADFDIPGMSLNIDKDRIEKAEFFILVWIRDVVSKSVLIETGMASAAGKKCVVFAQRDAALPYLLRNPTAATQNIRKVEFDTIEGLADMVRRNGSWIFDFV